MRAIRVGIAILTVAASISAARAYAAGTEACGTTTDSTLTTSSAPTPIGFMPYRLGQPETALEARDLELHLDPLYGSTLTDDMRNTLRQYVLTLLNSLGWSPIALDGNNLQTVYNYLRREGSDWNQTNARDSLAFRVANASIPFPDGDPDHPLSAYTNLDRSHSDVYITAPSRTGFGGQFPSPFFGEKEDVSSSRAIGDLRRRNSVMVRGPQLAQFLDVNGSGWTAPGALRRLNFNHELQHSLPPVNSPNESGEFWSAAAEVVGGVYDTTASVEVPYTWPLFSHESPGSCGNNRGAGSNYQARTAFAAYLAYNFLNADANRTLLGMRDDLLHRWAVGPAALRSANGLLTFLRDDSCWTCAGKSYFHPNGTSLSAIDRLNLLHHNWRVANFVNNPSLAEGQYGYPAWGGFSPSKNQKAWQTFDGCGADDIVAIPAIAQLGLNRLFRDTTFTGIRTFRGSTMPLILAPFAANYWVLRAAPDTWASDRDLVLRISTRNRLLYMGLSGAKGGARLMASTAAYSQADVGDESILWQHPEWVTNVTDPQWVDTDSLAGDILIRIPGFGLTNKSILLTLTMGDGGSTEYTTQTPQTYRESLPYRIDAMLLPPGVDVPAPSAVSATVGAFEGAAAWSPNSNSLIFMATLPQYSSFTQIYTRALGAPLPTRVLPQEAHQYSPDWSPRGDHLAFVGDRVGEFGNSLWIVDLNTYPATPTPLTALVGYETLLAFQPDGQALAYTYQPPFASVHQLRHIGVDGGGDRLLASFAAGSPPSPYSRPVWNASGSRVYISIGDSIYSVSKQGGTLTFESGLPLNTRSFDLPLGIGPMAVEDSRLINFGRWTGYAEYSAGEPDLPTHRLALVDTAIARRDTLYRYVGRRTETLNPRLSPNGLRVAFTQRSASELGDIFTAPLGYNHAPVFQNLEDVGIEACVPFTMPLTATDPDGDPISLKTYQLPPGAHIQGGNSLRWQSPSPGVYYAIFRALDPRGGVDSRVIRFNVFEGSACGEGLAEGGDPGNGFGVRRADQSRLHPDEQVGTASGNSLMDGAESNVWIDRFARVSPRRDDALGLAHISLVATRTGTARIDRVRLISVDHPNNTVALAQPDGIVVSQLESPASWICSEEGLSLPIGEIEANEPTIVRAGTTIEFLLPPGGLGVVLDCARTSGSGLEVGLGIRPQLPIAEGWADGPLLYPRKYRDMLAAPAGGSARLRLCFAADVQLWRVSAYHPMATELGPSSMTELAVIAQASGSLATLLGAADDQAVELAVGESVPLTFATPITAEAMTRTDFIRLRAAFNPPSAEEYGSRQTENAPLEFSLHRNEPNPFGANTTIRFALPSRAHVQLEVYDSQGRRVRTLIGTDLAAGIHDAAWEGRDDEGRRLAPGVYLYRLRAGTNEQTRRLVLLGH